MKIYFKKFGFALDENPPCENCYAPGSDIHHIVFKSQGGKDEINNLICLCRDCHDRAHFKKEPYLREDEVRTVHNKFLIDAGEWN